MDGVGGTLGDTPGVSINQSHLASPSQQSPRVAPNFSSPTMTRMDSPVAGSATNTSVAQSPNVKANAVGSNSTGVISTSSVTQSSPAQVNMRPGATAAETGKVLDKRRLQELVKEVDPLEQLDDDVEEMLMQIADDFIDNVVSASCQLAKHRKSNTVEVKDVQLHLERNWNMWIPGFGSEELKPYKKSATTEAHKQRLALIKKTLKKY